MKPWLLAFLLFAPQDDPVPKLVQQLGSEDYEVRNKASEELLKLGEKAKPYLTKALEDKDPEVCARARDLLKEIAKLSFRGFGLFEPRRVEKPKRAEGAGGGTETEAAVLAALRWLARHQSADDSWGAQSFAKTCKGACNPSPGEKDFDAGVTGLALLAFLGAGHSPLSKETHDGLCFGDVVKKGLQWVMDHQDREGFLGPRTAQKYMYNHAIGALALVEAYALTRSDEFKRAAQRAVDFTAAAQNTGKGWRYSYKCGDNDTSVTFWAAFSLRAAWHAGFEVRPAVFGGMTSWLDEVTEEETGRVGYTHLGTGKVFVPGMNENFDHHETLAAMGGFLRILTAGGRSDLRVTAGMDLLLRDKPAWGGNSNDFYYWHAASLAIFQFDGPDGKKWKAWNEDLKKALLPNQHPAADGCKSGSWEPVDRWSGEAGRVYATALNALTLETYYRYKRAPRD